MTNLSYSKKVFELVRNPKNMGEIKNPDGTATVGNPVCVLPGTLVSANNKVAQIKSIKKGEKVLSHDGLFHSVLKIYKRNYSGKIYLIRAHNLGEIVVTPEHHILALKMANTRYKFEAFRKKKAISGWFNAEQLEEGDVILYPIAKRTKNRSLIKTNVEKSCWDFKSVDLPREVVVDENFLRLVGYYLAEGYLRTRVTRKTFGFVFGSHEVDLINDTISLMGKMFGFSPSHIRTFHNSTNLIFYRAQLVHFFQKLFGKGALNKHLPDWMMVLPLEKQTALLCGLWKGDGYINKEKKTAKFVTISHQLAYQMRQLLLRQKIIFSFLTSSEEGIHKKHYSIYIKEDSSLKKLASILGLEVNFPSKRKKPHKSWFDNDYYYVPIWRVKTFKYDGPVYNLKVENSASYVSNAATLHNCGDIMRLYIRVGKRASKEYLKEVKFQTLGCPAAIATSSILTEMVKGKTLREAVKVNNQQIVKELGGLPEFKLHCSVLAAQALKKAITDYQKKKDQKR